MSQSFLVFPNDRSLLRGLEQCVTTQSADFPAQLWRNPEGHLALPVEGVVPEAVEFLQAQDDTIGLAANAGQGAQPVCLSEILRLDWVRFDPIRDNPHVAMRRALPSTEQQVLDSRAVQMRYILAARDRRRSERLLGRLTRFLTPDITVRPVSVINGDDDEAYQFLWSVSGRISSAILNDADRVWCGRGLRDRRFDVFQEWPYKTRLSDNLLQRINWGDDGSLVLLGPGNPEKVILASGQDTTLKPLLDCTKLEVGSVQPAVALQPDDSKTEVPFDVQMRLIDRSDRQNSVRQRMRDIDRKINQLKIARDRLEQTANESEHEHYDRDAYEPMFVYYDFNRNEQAPYELQRLLIEWADQEGDLSQVYYRRVEAQSLDPENDGGVAHIITSAAALGLADQAGPGASTLGLRLGAYRPLGQGRHSSFSLLHSWTRFGLRLFVPHAQFRWQLKIYPEPPLSEVSAGKLADALEIPNTERGQWCGIMLPRKDGHIHCSRFRIQPAGDDGDGFRPLLDVFQWNCALDVSVSRAQPLRHGDDASELMLSGINRRLDEAVETQMQPWLAELDQQIGQVRQEFELRRAQADLIDDRIRHLPFEHAKTQEELKELEAELGRVDRKRPGLNALIRDENAAMEMYTDIAETVESTRETQDRVRQQRDECEEIRDDIGQIVSGQSHESRRTQGDRS